MTTTVGNLRAALSDLPDDAPVVAEWAGEKFNVRQVLAIGTRTDDPALVIQLVQRGADDSNMRCPECGSRNVNCRVHDTDRHTHECFNCGHSMTWKRAGG